MVHARGIEAGSPRRRTGESVRKRPARSGAEGQGARRAPLFQLFDRRKRFEPPKTRRPRHPPRITRIGIDDWTPYPRRAIPDPGAPRDTARLCRRLWALHLALVDPDKHARRLLRWRAMRAARRAAGEFLRYVDPLRPGWPPGHRQRGREEIHELLLELDRLARRTLRSGSGAGAIPG